MLSSYGIKNANAPFNPNERRLAPVNNRACLAKPSVERVLVDAMVAIRGVSTTEIVGATTLVFSLVI